MTLSLFAPVHAWPHLPRVLPTVKPTVNSLTYFSNLTRGPWTGSGVVQPDCTQQFRDSSVPVSVSHETWSQWAPFVVRRSTGQLELRVKAT